MRTPDIIGAIVWAPGPSSNIVEKEAAPLDERLSALATLLRDPKPEYVATAAKVAQTQGAAISAHLNTAREVEGALNHVKNPEALPSLVAIFESNVETWHEPAMYVIRVMQDPKTIPLLIKALDDPDPGAEYQALAALR
jgi:HEAT repeat protein